MFGKRKGESPETRRTLTLDATDLAAAVASGYAAITYTTTSTLVPLFVLTALVAVGAAACGVSLLVTTLVLPRERVAAPQSQPRPGLVAVTIAGALALAGLLAAISAPAGPHWLTSGAIGLVGFSMWLGLAPMAEVAGAFTYLHGLAAHHDTHASTSRGSDSYSRN